MKTIDEKLLKQIGKKLLKARQTIALAESVTAGSLQLAMSSIPDAAKFFQGGITAYNIAQKFKHLKVEPIHALEVNCVSQKVAHEMARHVTEMFGSHWGIAVTGYASPVPESGNKTFAYFSICLAGKVKAYGKLNLAEKKPADLQQSYSLAILQKLHQIL